MMTSDTNPKAQFYFDKPGPWQEAFTKLRIIALECPLTEELKWGHPCYSLEGRNIVLMHGFKDYCALLFFKGALMRDPAEILIQQTDNVQAARQIRFTEAGQVDALAETLKAYIHNAIEVETSGLKVTFKPVEALAVPEEFQIMLNEDPELNAAFKALTPGRRKGYLLHFASAKQAKTREARIEKAVPLILGGKGLDD